MGGTKWVWFEKKKKINNLSDKRSKSKEKGKLKNIFSRQTKLAIDLAPNLAHLGATDFYLVPKLVSSYFNNIIYIYTDIGSYWHVHATLWTSVS